MRRVRHRADPAAGARTRPARATGRYRRAAAGGVMLALGLGGAAAQSGTAGMRLVTVEVELSCPSCAQGLERRLRRLDQVAAVEVRAADGEIIVTPASGRSVDLDSIREVVRNAGFIPDAVVVRAAGRLMTRDGRRGLVLPDETVLGLAADGRAAALAATADGRLVTVTGRLVSEPGALDRLQVETFEVAE